MQSKRSETWTDNQIAKRAGVGVGTVAYKTKDEVMEWMLDIQLGRRNLTPIQRIAVAEKYRPIYEKQAKENQLSGLVQNKNTVSVNLPKREPVNTSEKLASIAGVSEKTYRMGAKVLSSNNEDLKQEVLSGGELLYIEA